MVVLIIKRIAIGLCIVIVIAAIWAAWVVSKPEIYPVLTPEQHVRLDSLTPTAGEGGNSITVYTEFDTMYAQLMADIEGARHHVHTQFFKFEDDSIGRALGERLGQKAAEGVECRLMYDDWCCRSWRALYRHIDSLGVTTAGYNRVRLPFFGKRHNYRNHRKVVVIDGTVGYVGGINIADRYRKGLDWGRWDDLMVRIEGPAVAQLQRSFAVDWLYATGSLIDNPRYYATATADEGARAHVVNSGPMEYGPQIEQLTIDLLKASRRYIYFESPYFIPTDEVMQALCDAARRGVDVRIMQPPRGDRGETTQHASHYHFSEALTAGAKIMVFESGYMHSKLIVADDSIGVVTSSNIDPRSYRLNQEIALVVEDETFARRLRAVYEEDEQQSHPVDAAQWEQRSLGARIMQWLTHLIEWQL